MWDAWELRRRGADPVGRRRDELERLRQLGVRMTEIPPTAARTLLLRFADEFVAPERAEGLRAEVRRARLTDRPVEVARLLRPDRARRGGSEGAGRWLAAGDAGARCVRFERCLALPGLRIELGTLDDAWAASWPGTFVNFEAGRAVVITLDYEELRCDLRVRAATPYR